MYRNAFTYIRICTCTPAFRLFDSNTWLTAQHSNRANAVIADFIMYQALCHSSFPSCFLSMLVKTLASIVSTETRNYSIARLQHRLKNFILSPAFMVNFYRHLLLIRRKVKLLAYNIIQYYYKINFWPFYTFKSVWIELELEQSLRVHLHAR